MQAPLRLWRETRDDMRALPGVSMGQREITDTPPDVTELFESGLRCLTVDEPVRLAGPALETLRTLVLIRDLTSQGIAVEWELDCGGDLAAAQRLVHLSPPLRVTGAEGTGEFELAWREKFYVCKCLYRKGPGFIQVRDRRAGSLARFTITDSGYLEAIERLLPGCHRADIPPSVAAALQGESLALPFGDYLWWAPYRVRRWPSPSMTV